MLFTGVTISICGRVAVTGVVCSSRLTGARYQPVLYALSATPWRHVEGTLRPRGPAYKRLLLFRLPNQELSLARRALGLALKHRIRTAHHLNLPDAFGDLRLLVKALGQAFRKGLVGLGPICVHE